MAIPRIVGFTPLSGSEGMFVASFRNPEQDGEGRLWYGLLEKRGSDYRLGFPMCKETRSIAESVGAEFVPDPKGADMRLFATGQAWKRG